MKTTDLLKITVTVSLLLFAIAIFILGVFDKQLDFTGVGAQKAERGTQQWTIDVLNPVIVTASVKIHVIDTSGVCLYVVHDSTGSNMSSIAAIPKTQLPQGAGCQ